jgi:hypothetical protein
MNTPNPPALLNKTTVEIEWDEPSDKNWLCADNISIALHSYCTNTKFRVTEVDPQQELKVARLVSALKAAQELLNETIDKSVKNGHTDDDQFNGTWASYKAQFAEALAFWETHK